MPNANAQFGESVMAGIGKSGDSTDMVSLGGVFTVTCYDSEGNLKWEDKFHNLVTSQGLQDLNTKYFKTTSPYTPAWYLGLIAGTGPTSFAAADTLATVSWSEFINYTGTTRNTMAFGTATTATPSVIANTTGTGGSPSVYTISSSGGTIAGAFLTTVQNKSTTGGVLFSEGDFTGGYKTVAAGDTVNVTYTFTADI